jgi:hypothetical protein
LLGILPGLAAVDAGVMHFMVIVVIVFIFGIALLAIAFAVFLAFAFALVIRILGDYRRCTQKSQNEGEARYFR